MKFSIIVPVYNVEKYVQECLLSIKNQTYNDWECVVINDGSTDNSYAKCLEITKDDDRFVLINQNNSGVSATRNNGINYCSGEFVLFVDSDDYIDIKLLEKLNDFICEKKADIVFFNYNTLYENGEILPCDFYSIFNEENINKDTVFYNYFKYSNMGNVWGKAIKLSVIKDNNLKFNNEYFFAEDQIFCYELFLVSCNIACLRERLYYYRIRNTSIVQSYNAEKLINMEKYADFLRINISKLETNSDEYEKFLNQMLTHLLFKENSDIFNKYDLDKKEKKKAYLALKNSSLIKYLTPTNLKERLLANTIKSCYGCNLIFYKLKIILKI